jgi:hypothetical protein
MVTCCKNNCGGACLKCLNGPRGLRGPQGSIGPRGENGYTGAQGETGARGPVGAQGTQGQTGSTGSTGAKGATGFTGPQGHTGYTGAQGATGTPGDRFNTQTTQGFSLPIQQGGTTTSIVEKQLAYISGNSVVVTDPLSPLSKNFEATIALYDSSTGGIVFTDIINILGDWSDYATIFPVNVNLDGINGATGPTGVTGFTGATGWTGSTGAQGATGPTILDENGNLNMFCKSIIDVSGVQFCDNSYIGQGTSFDISANQIINIRNNNDIIIDPSNNLIITGTLDMSNNHITNANTISAGTSSIVSAAIMQLDSTTKGFLPPRMTSTEALAIISPVEGLIIYVTDTNITFTSKGWWGYDGSIWKQLG